MAGIFLVQKVRKRVQYSKGTPYAQSVLANRMFSKGTLYSPDLDRAELGSWARATTRRQSLGRDARTRFAALLTISRDDHSFSLTQAFTDAIDAAERRETAERRNPSTAVPPAPARAAPPRGGGGAPGPP